PFLHAHDHTSISVRMITHVARFERDPVCHNALSLFFIYQDLPGLPMALRVSGRLTVLPTS
ncbi:hypothetical protein, partial [Streptomyces sp. NPDC048496]|uniref:hypothetical protein n=1 Tax=Streptomyces sp. NPDC048496 TaxID=3365558 RepID=UPI003717A977